MENFALIEKGKKSMKKIFSLESLSKIKIMKNYIYNKNYRTSVINKIKNNDNKRKIRNPGIDLVRILSMYAIIIHHILYFGNLFIKYNKYKELVLMNISCFWHVNSYALISGYIGYKSHKYSNLLFLWICVLFYSLSITYFFEKYKSEMNIDKIQFKDYFPVNFEKYWYFTKYFGMYLFLPVINKGIASMTNSDLRIVVISLIFIYVILKDMINPKKDIYRIRNGNSVLWLLIYYIIGAYFGKFKKELNGINRIILIVFCTFVFYFSTSICFYFLNFPLDNLKGYFAIKAMKILKQLFVLRVSSVPMILQSISITLILTHINYNKYLSKIISFLGPLTFGVYLIHNNPIVINKIFKKFFENRPYNLSLYSIIKSVLIKGIKIYGICLIIDYLRLILFNLLRFKKICIFFEKCIYKIF